MKSVYALQPYYVGSKRGRSLALIIPSKVVKKFHLDVSTIFALTADNCRKMVTIETLFGSEKKVKTDLKSLDKKLPNSIQKMVVNHVEEIPKNAS